MRVLVLVWALLWGAARLEAADPPAIGPAEALDNVDRQVTLEFRVLSAHWLDDKDVTFLNSERDNRHRNNVTAFISPQGMRAYREQCKIENPAARFIDRTIRVQGQVQKYRGRAEIQVKSPAQIQILPTGANAPSPNR